MPASLCVGVQLQAGMEVVKHHFGDLGSLTPWQNNDYFKKKV